jgi:ketosteroid isomerase-like protein
MTSAHPETPGRVLLALPFALLVACAASKPPSSTPSSTPVERAQQEALAADAAFAAASMAHDQRAFAAFIARDAVFVGHGGVSAGVAAVCNDWAPLLVPGGPTLSWKPVSALASSGGDLVVTRGAWALQPPGSGELRTGRYLTAWERGADGKLKVALDASDTPLPPGSAGAERRPLKRILSDDGRLGAVAGLLLEGSREVGGFMLVEVREGEAWRVVAEVGRYRPSLP